jgi:hypothetical protein
MTTMTTTTTTTTDAGDLMAALDVARARVTVSRTMCHIVIMRRNAARIDLRNAMAYRDATARDAATLAAQCADASVMRLATEVRDVAAAAYALTGRAYNEACTSLEIAEHTHDRAIVHMMTIEYALRDIGIDVISR